MPQDRVENKFGRNKRQKAKKKYILETDRRTNINDAKRQASHNRTCAVNCARILPVRYGSMVTVISQLTTQAHLFNLFNLCCGSMGSWFLTGGARLEAVFFFLLLTELKPCTVIDCGSREYFDPSNERMPKICTGKYSVTVLVIWVSCL